MLHIRRVAHVLEWIIEPPGVPDILSCDNGQEVQRRRFLNSCPTYRCRGLDAATVVKTVLKAVALC